MERYLGDTTLTDRGVPERARQFSVDFGGLAWPESADDALRDAPGACDAIAAAILGRDDAAIVDVAHTPPVQIVARLGMLSVAVDGVPKADAQRTSEPIHDLVIATVRRAVDQTERTVPDFDPYATPTPPPPTAHEGELPA